MKPASTFQYLCLSRLSRPAHERCLYRALRTTKARSLVEIGIADGRRTMRLLAVAQHFQPQAQLSYAGIDLFEARPAGTARLTLKDAHRRLMQTGVHVRLVPGDPFSALARCANALTGTDLLVISADQDAASLEQAWFFVPRMLHERSLVFVEERVGQTGRRFRRLTAADVGQRAPADSRRRAA